jgi:hypothetical protein
MSDTMAFSYARSPRSYYAGFVVGGLLALAGLLWLSWTAVFVLRAAKASGQITDMAPSSGRRGTSWYPIFMFMDAHGVLRTKRSHVGSSSNTFVPGQQVTVLYLPSDPQNCEIDSFHTLWFGPLCFTVLGLACGGLNYRQYRKSKLAGVP